MERCAAIITGDRNGGTDWESSIIRSIEPLGPETNPFVIIHGAARGIDAVANGAIGVKYPNAVRLMFPAKWDLYELMGNRNGAGPARNGEMLHKLLNFRDAGWQVAVLAFHPFIHNSKGTANMLSQGKRAGVPCFLFNRDGGFERW